MPAVTQIHQYFLSIHRKSYTQGDQLYNFLFWIFFAIINNEYVLLIW